LEPLLLLLEIRQVLLVKLVLVSAFLLLERRGGLLCGPHLVGQRLLVRGVTLALLLDPLLLLLLRNALLFFVAAASASPTITLGMGNAAGKYE
jgi:hypothetical protein